MSYRRAWLLLDELNRPFHERLATTADGCGSHGGGVQLTPFGRDLIEAFRGVEREANTLARKRLSKLVPNSVGKVAAGKAEMAKLRARSLARRKRVGVVSTPNRFSASGRSPKVQCRSRPLPEQLRQHRCAR
jgi:molybdate transport repressor ModE-like protein